MNSKIPMKQSGRSSAAFFISLYLKCGFFRAGDRSLERGFFSLEIAGGETLRCNGRGQRGRVFAG